MNTLIWIIGSTFFVSLIAFVGLIVMLVKENFLGKILLWLVALSAGVLMGSAFLHLIPESLESFSYNNAMLFVLVGFVSFFVLENIFYWRHCHEGKCPVHTFVYMNLVGDGVHNFIDGMVIASAFSLDIKLGIITTLAIALHEIPQEIGDFGVLVYGGFGKMRALTLNFLFALLAIAGGLVGYFISSYSTASMGFLLPFAAGSFIYIAASDLIPELKNNKKLKKSIPIFIVFIMGLLLTEGIKLFG